MWRQSIAALALICAAGTALALDYRSVEVPVAILYDSPSQKGKKLYLMRAQTPVEVVVRVEGWFKVRDAEGTMAWIEARNVGERRTATALPATSARHRSGACEDCPAWRRGVGYRAGHRLCRQA
jgi:SH3-like domain-containing protein